MTDYDRRVAFSGDAAKAFDTAQSVFINHGFLIVAKDSSSLEVQGPGMNNSKQHPLLGASRIRVFVECDSLGIEADVGAVKRLVKMITLLIVGLGVGLSLVFLAMFGVHFSVATPLAALAPWIVLLPVFYFVFNARSRRALDVLQQNISTLADSAETPMSEVK
ncbi:MAG: hypothetical protein H8E66_15050 [Planctomycetes bacterium]|nr:hypothetical protein [Planctomycetota bacterium]